MIYHSKRDLKQWSIADVMCALILIHLVAIMHGGDIRSANKLS